MTKKTKTAYKPFTFYKKGTNIRITVTPPEEVDTDLISPAVLADLEERGIFNKPKNLEDLPEVAKPIGMTGDNVQSLTLDEVKTLTPDVIKESAKGKKPVKQEVKNVTKDANDGNKSVLAVLKEKNRQNSKGNKEVDPVSADAVKVIPTKMETGTVTGEQKIDLSKVGGE